MPHLVDFAKTHKYDFVTLSGDQVKIGGDETVDGGHKSGGHCLSLCICLMLIVAINDRHMIWLISMVSREMNT